jgi:hypothetical protein
VSSSIPPANNGGIKIAPNNRADLLGSSPLTLLVRCLCGRRNYIDRSRFAYFGRAVCDNFRCLIDYNSFRVRISDWRRVNVEALEFDYDLTDERKAIIDGLQSAQDWLEHVAGLLRASGQQERAQRTLNLAQGASSQKCLLAQDWHFADLRKVA